MIHRRFDVFSIRIHYFRESTYIGSVGEPHGTVYLYGLSQSLLREVINRRGQRAAHLFDELLRLFANCLVGLLDGLVG